MATVGTRQHARLRRRRHRVTVALLLFAIVTVVAVRWGASHGDDSLGSSGNQSHYGASVDSAGAGPLHHPTSEAVHEGMSLISPPCTRESIRSSTDPWLI